MSVPSSEGVGRRGGREREGVSETGCRRLCLRGREKFMSAGPLGSIPIERMSGNEDLAVNGREGGSLCESVYGATS